MDQFQTAIEENNCEAVTEILENNSTMDLSEVRAANGQPLLHISVMNACLMCCQILLTHGSDINLQNGEGMTALMLSCERGNTDICELLLSNGADTEITNASGETALHVAALTGHLDHFEGVKLLLKHGANANAQSPLGRTALHITVYQTSSMKVDNSFPLSLFTDFLSRGARADLPGRCKDVLQGLETFTAFELALMQENVCAIVTFTEAGFRIPQKRVMSLVTKYRLPNCLIQRQQLREYLSYKLSQPQSLMSLCKNVYRTEDLPTVGLPHCLVSYIRNTNLCDSCKEITDIITNPAEIDFFAHNETRFKGIFHFKVTEILH